MRSTSFMQAAALALLGGMLAAPGGQAAAAGMSRAAPVLAQATMAPAGSENEGAKMGQPGQSGAMPAETQDMMGGMMRRGMMGGMMSPGMQGMPMMEARRMMMKIMFAIADTNGDGALSFDEIMAIHKRIFDMIEANKDGKITIDEIEAFMRE